MQFLSPAAIAIAAALTIPPLVALYFLKLKRKVHPISSTLLWKKAIEDLHVNAPFQRLRASLLLFLQLLVLILAALALGEPMLTREKEREDTLILMIDQSASMAVIEQDNKTRLDIAKQEAKKVIDAMDENSRAMVLAFCDRATMVSSFDTDKEALKRKIDTIEQTDSLSQLNEAVVLAEAYSQNMVIGGEVPGADIEVQTSAATPSVLLFSDGRLADADELSPQRLDLSRMEVVVVGERDDNVGIIAMDARRNYEQPEMVQAFATVRNFAAEPMEFDATLYIEGQPLDVQTVTLGPGLVPPPRQQQGQSQGPDDDLPVAAGGDGDETPPPGSVASVAFDEVVFEGGGLVEVRLSTRDGLQADDRAWSVLPSPRRVAVLLVTDGNWALQRVLSSLNIDLQMMTPAEYERAPSEELVEGQRSRYDVIVFDRHSTDRLPVGNYMFWGSVPRIEGVEPLGMISDQVIIDWDEDHPILRNVAVGRLNVYAWMRLKLPNDAVRLIEGETEDSTLLAYFARAGSQFLICTFPFVFTDDEGRRIDNTDWYLKDDFVPFNDDAVGFLAASTHTGGRASIEPGEPKTVPIPRAADSVLVRRPDGGRDRIPTAGSSTVTYARTRRVGPYTIEPAAEGHEMFAVNLFSPDESRIAPERVVVLGSTVLAAAQGKVLVNEPLWPWVLVALLVILLLEWIVYNKRVYV
jgi:hypothetical protein